MPYLTPQETIPTSLKGGIGYELPRRTWTCSYPCQTIHKGKSIRWICPARRIGIQTSTQATLSQPGNCRRRWFVLARLQSIANIYAFVRVAFLLRGYHLNFSFFWSLSAEFGIVLFAWDADFTTKSELETFWFYNRRSTRPGRLSGGWNTMPPMYST